MPRDTSGQMNDLPRQTLCGLIAKYGNSLCDEPLRCEGLLRDLCAQHRREVNVLVNALRERVATDLLSSSSSEHVEFLLSRLTKRLEEHQALSTETARWAVESWALALGKISAKELTAGLQPGPGKASQVDVRQPLRDSGQRFRETAPAKRSKSRVAQSTGVGVLVPSGSPRRSGRWIGFIIVLLCLTGIGVAAWYFNLPSLIQSRLAEKPQGTSAAPVNLQTSAISSPYPIVSAYSPTPAPISSISNEGSLLVTTEPSGAMVVIDGTTTRITPTVVSHVSVGQHHLRITLERYETEERDVEVKNDEIATTGQIVLRARRNPFDGEWVVAKTGWRGILRINGQAASLSLTFTDRMKANWDHWNNMPAPYNRIRTLSYEWRAESKSVRVTSLGVDIYWNEWTSQSTIPLSILRKNIPRPASGYNIAYPPSQDWGFVAQGSTLVTGDWRFNRKD